MFFFPICFLPVRTGDAVGNADGILFAPPILEPSVFERLQKINTRRQNGRVRVARRSTRGYDRVDAETIFFRR